MFSSLCPVVRTPTKKPLPGASRGPVRDFHSHLSGIYLLELAPSSQLSLRVVAGVSTGQSLHPSRCGGYVRRTVAGDFPRYKAIGRVVLQGAMEPERANRAKPMPSLPKPRLRRGARASQLPGPAEPQRERKPNVETIDGEGLRWVHIESPTQLEMGWLEEHFDFHPLDLEDVLSRNQRPKIDEYPDYLFIVLHFPVFDHSVKRLNAGELDIFVGPRLPGHDPEPVPAAGLVPVRALPLEGGDCASSTSPRARATCSTGSSTTPSTTASRCCARSATSSTRVEDEIFEGRSDEVVRDISNVKQEIINFRKVIRPQRTVLRGPREGSKQASWRRARASWRSTSTTSATRTSGSGTSSRTTRRSSRGSRTRTSRCSPTASTTSCASSPRSA